MEGMHFCQEDIKMVYDMLEDELSKNVFKYRAMYNVEGGKERLDQMLCFSEVNRKGISSNLKVRSIADEKLSDDETIVFYGAGVIGKRFYEVMSRENPKLHILFCDKKFEIIKKISVAPVISPDVLFKEYTKHKVVITMVDNIDEVANFLIAKGISRENVYAWRKSIHDVDNHYFEEGIIQLTENEVFVDAGAYDGETSLRFVEKCKGKYGKIYLVEPDDQHIEKTRRKTAHLDKVACLNIGLWDKEDQLQFSDDHTQSSKIIEGEDNSNKIKVNSIDNIVQGEAVTFIKMDIEGAELKALQGAEATIKAYKPKLAISVYHKPEDIVTIPLYIKELVPEYKFYMRHYTNWASETVLYAVID